MTAAEHRVLPVEPLEAWFRRARARLGLPASAGPSAVFEEITDRPRRVWVRYRKWGALTVKSGDEIVTRCGLHGRDVWGDRWDDPYRVDPADWPWPWWYPDKERG